MVSARSMRACHLATLGRRTGSQDRMPPAHAVGVIARSERAQQASSDSWAGEMQLSIASSSVSSPCSVSCHSPGASVWRRLCRRRATIDVSPRLTSTYAIVRAANRALRSCSAWRGSRGTRRWGCREPGLHGRQSGIKPTPSAFSVHRHTLHQKPALKQCPISLALCLVTS